MQRTELLQWAGHILKLLYHKHMDYCLDKNITKYNKLYTGEIVKSVEYTVHFSVYQKGPERFGRNSFKPFLPN